ATIPAIVLTFIGAFFWSCLIEIPFGNIEAIMLRSIMRQRHGRCYKNMENEQHYNDEILPQIQAKNM
ncbi:hypothetical protein PMAYCL1PPCAC_16549, partial [Pristionchus mayeri]